MGVNTINIDHGTMTFTSAPNGGGIAASTVTLTGGTMAGGGGSNGFDWYYGNSSNPTLFTLASSDHSAISANVNIRLNANTNNVTFNVAQGTTSDGVNLLLSGNVTTATAGDAKGGIIKTGPGTMLMTGVNTYSGTTSVNAGNLYVNGSISGAVTVAGSATLGGQGSVGLTAVQAGGILQGGYNGFGTLTLGSLTFASSATINVVPSTTVVPLNVSGSNGLTANGGAASVAVNIGTTSLSAGNYPLIGYSGAIQGGGLADFTIGTKPADTNIYSLKTIAGTPSYIDLFVALNAPYWTGSNSNTWDTTTQNWQVGGAGGSPSLYSDGLAVVFDDSAGTNGTVLISGTDVAPASVTFNNSALAYNLQGTNAIAGTASLTKSGSGMLTIANTNSFMGPVNFNGGTIAVGSVALGGQNSPLGAGTSLAFAGGTLEYTGIDAAPSRTAA